MFAGLDPELAVVLAALLAFAPEPEHAPAPSPAFVLLRGPEFEPGAVDYLVVAFAAFAVAGPLVPGSSLVACLAHNWAILPSTGDMPL